MCSASARNLTCYDSDTETLVDPDGSPYYKTMRQGNQITPERSPPLRQTRSTATSSSNETTNRNRTSSSPVTTKRKAKAAALANINTTMTAPASRKRKRSIGDEIEVRSARSRESSISTSSTLSRRGSSESVQPSSITPPLNSPFSAKRLNKINRRNQAGETPLHRASAAGKLDEVRELLEKGASVNEQCNAGWTPLHKACLKGYTDIVRLLCQHGAKTDIGSTDEHDTPLHDACSNGHKDVVLVLLDYGANPRVQNSEGNFPHEMVDDDMHELKKIIMDATKAFKETKKESHDDREDSEPPISPAMKRHSRRTSTASDAPFQPNLGVSRPKRGAPAGKDDLLARDITYRDPHRRTHLHLRAAQGNDWFVKELLNMGANHSAKDRDGNTPLHLAARGGHKDVVGTLLTYGAEVNAPSKQGETPLHEVAGRGHKDIVDMLLFYGANPTKKDVNGRTALDVAIESASTAAEGEIDLLRQKFVEFGGVLPEVEKDLNVKMEEVEEAPPVSDEVDRERENTANEYSTSTLPSPTLDSRILPINEVDEKTPEPTVVNGDNEDTSEDANEAARLTPRVSGNIEDAEEETRPEEMQLDEPEIEVSTAEAQSLEDLAEPASQPDPAPETLPPSEEEVFADEPTVEETMIIEVLKEPAPEEVIKRDPSPPTEPQPKPRWMELSALDSLTESFEKEVSPLLPLYTMQFKGEDKVYVAHTQVCCILGFTTEDFFSKCLFLVFHI